MQTYTKKEIETLIYIKNNGCRKIMCTDCPIDKKQCSKNELHKVLFNSKKIAKLILESIISY